MIIEKTKYKYLILLFVGIIVSNGLLSQQHVNKQGYWISYLGDNKINDKIGIHSEAQLRNHFVSEALETSFFRVGLNYYTSSSSIITAGYGFFYNEPSDNETAVSTVRENRAWQQLIMRKKTPLIFMEHRYRLEQRFIDNRTANSSMVDHRIRYRYQAIFPFYTFSPYLRHFFLAGYNEVMLNFRKNTAEVFDRNRLYFALGIQVSPKLNFQFGYLNQQAVQPGFDNHEVNHLAQIAVSYNMDDLMRGFFSNNLK